jgi:hypothetical protein
MGNRATTIFDAEDSKFQAAYKRVDRALLNIQSKFAAAGKAAALPVAAIATAVSALAVGIKHQIDNGNELYRIGKQTGVAVRDLVLIGKEFKNAGLSADDAAHPIQKMLNSIATHAADSTIAQLGVNLEELKTKTPAEQFHELGAAIATLPDAASRVAAAREIFGKEGANLLAVFSEKGFGDAAREVGYQAETLQRNAALFHQTSRDLDRASEQMKNFMLGVADKLVPVVQPLLQLMAAKDQSAAGENLGGALGVFAGNFINGQLGEVFATQIKIAAASSADFFAGAFLAVLTALGGELYVSVSTAISLLAVPTTAAFWEGMGDALMVIGHDFVSLLLRGVAAMLEKFSMLPGIGKKAAEGAASLRESASSQAGKGKDSLVSGTGKAFDVFEKLASGWQERQKNVLEGIAIGFDTGTKLFNVEGLKQHLDDLTAQGADTAQETTARTRKKFPGDLPAPGDASAFLEFGASKAPLVSALQRIGGVGGNISGGATRDPVVSQVERSNTLLEKIHAAILNGRPYTGSDLGSQSAYA